MSRIRPDARASGAYDSSPIPAQAHGRAGGIPEEEGQDRRTIRVYHRCGGCGKKQEFLNSGKFRVNANGNNVDVWLIYRCRKCKHSWNLTIYERTKPGRIPTALFEAFQANDAETAAAYGRNIEFLKKNNAEFK